MAGELVPLVLLPRYTTLAGVDYQWPYPYLTTVAIGVTQYERAIVTIWRGPVVGTSPVFKLLFQESMDRDFWDECNTLPAQDPSGEDPGADTQAQYVVELRARWLRVRILLGDSDNVVNCWATGFLEVRST